MNPKNCASKTFNLITNIGYFIALSLFVAYFVSDIDIESKNGNLVLGGIILTVFFWGIYRAYFAKPSCHVCKGSRMRFEARVDSDCQSFRIFKCNECGASTSIKSLKNSDA
ncbi:MAG: hypothetical protein QM496_04775 [Verrucomicrobiota bacterium]